MTFLLFLIGMAMLGWSGWGIAWQVIPAGDRWLQAFVALPLGALVHVLFLAILTLIGVPIAAWILLPLHVFVGAAALYAPTPYRPASLLSHPDQAWTYDTYVRIVLCVLLGVQALFAFTHAVVLPTYHIDSLTNWTMRAKVSWLDEQLAFDQTEVRGVAKPQYPFLVHGVQMAAHVVALQWSDRAANASTLALTLSSLGVLFLLLKRLRGTTIALGIIAAITHIPLLSFHLAQGYGDIHLVAYLLLALGFVLAARIAEDARWYIGSALFIGAASWTKTEGIVIGLVPWLLLVGIDLPWPQQGQTRIVALVKGVVLSLLFPLFLLTKGLQLTPHESDALFGLQTEAFGPALAGFLSPSMGLTWLVILLAFIIAMRFWKTNDQRIDCRTVVTLGWGILALLIVLATYTLTPNARFLLNGESYFRQLMVPASLIILALAGSFRQTRS